MTIKISANKLMHLLQLGLLLVIVGLLVWAQVSDTDSSEETRKITVTGETTMEATPDEFTFYPRFEKQGSDKNALRDELVNDANKAVDAIKALGVPEQDIALDASSYDQWYWMDGEEGMLNITLTITTKDGDLAQKIQDYLITTDAEGQISPQATFSTEKKKELDKQAVEQAITDAKNKAQAQADLLGEELGGVLEVSQSRDSLFMNYGAAELSVREDVQTQSLPVLPGQNDYMQSVVVTYELR